MKMTVIIGSVIALAGAIVIVYKITKDKIIQTAKKIQMLDVDFIKSWISNIDMEKYNSSYTVCLMRKNEIPEKYYKIWNLFLDIKKCAYICIYDQQNKVIVEGQLLIFEHISEELQSDNFIEFPFE